MDWGSIGSAILGAGEFVYDIYSSGKEADIYEDNARAADLEAEYQQEIAQINLAQHESDIKKLVGQQRTAFVGSGVDVSAKGSVRDVIADTKREADFDAELIMRNAKIYESRYTMEAGISRDKADIATTTGYYEAGASLLSNWGKDI